MARDVAHARDKVIHRAPARDGCRSAVSHPMTLTTVELWMTLRTGAWVLCARCFTRAEQATRYDQAHDGRAVDIGP
jgi:hypothetical protein